MLNVREEFSFIVGGFLSEAMFGSRFTVCAINVLFHLLVGRKVKADPSMIRPVSWIKSIPNMQAPFMFETT